MKIDLLGKKMSKCIRIFLLLTCLWLTTSCSLIDKTLQESVKGTELHFPESEQYNSLVSVGDKLIVLVNGGDQDDLKYYAEENSKEFLEFPFQDDINCSPVEYHSYETFPDGRLQVWKYCLTGNGKLSYLLAYDWVTHQLEQVTGPLPLGSSGASWNPETTKAIGYLDSKFASKTLFWIMKNSYEPLDMVIGEKGHSWNLKDDFPDFKAADAGISGTTGRAAWSPDGNSIAFFAAPAAIGKTSFERFSVDYQLYLMNPTTLQPQVVADGIYSPFLLSWSPNSSYIAFVGKSGSDKESSLWLYSLADGSVLKVSDGIFQGLVWRSNGNSIVAIKCENNDVCSRVMEYDLAEILH